MFRVALVHWNDEEAAERLARLRRAGYSVVRIEIGASKTEYGASLPPDAYVIDLSRLPSHGLAVALSLRRRKVTRDVPLVFVDGLPKKVARVRRAIPDATFTTWPKIRGGLSRAAAHRTGSPLVPKSKSGPYSGTPLAKKLGLKPDTIVVLIGAPNTFERGLGQLPDGLVVRRGHRGERDLTIWFVRRQRDLRQRIDEVVARLGGGALWIAWPKKASGVRSDLADHTVRQVAIAAGLVDFKVCAIDDTWSGLKFVRRRLPKRD